MPSTNSPTWGVFPREEWIQVSPAAAGFDADGFQDLVSRAQVEGAAWEGEKHEGRDWGAVLARGGYLVHSWGDPDYRYQTASVGKAFTRALVGLAVRAGLIEADEPICLHWTGEGQLSHPHKYLNAGHHPKLTWRHLIGRADDTSKHWGGFPVTNGFFWRQGAYAHSRGGFVGGALAARPDGKGDPGPDWAQWTGDPFYDNYAHVEPGTQGVYASGGIWRLSQALTALWGRDLKAVLDDELFGRIGIRPERWDWIPGRTVFENREFYPSMPGYGDFIDPPYEIDGQMVRGGGGWTVMAASDLARFGLLVATGGVWEGEQLLVPEWVHSHGGGNGSRVEGDPTTFLSLGMVTTKGLPRLQDFAALVRGPGRG
ncbi:MAG: serine hydrolase [Candidatus Latescibacteria bacterium]|nr:serine hydrolase [Candidatus Latescibacterota bacterium]